MEACSYMDLCGWIVMGCFILGTGRTSSRHLSKTGTKMTTAHPKNMCIQIKTNTHMNFLELPVKRNKMGKCPGRAYMHAFLGGPFGFLLFSYLGSNVQKDWLFLIGQTEIYYSWFPPANALPVVTLSLHSLGPACLLQSPGRKWYASTLLV